MKKTSLKTKSLFLFSLLLLDYLTTTNGYILTGSFLLPMTSNITVQYDNSKSRGKKHFFTIPLNVGTPERSYNLQLDTSVTTSWIPSSRCRNCVGATTFYDEVKSTTSSPSDIPVELEDEDGDVEGYKITDNVHLGGYKLKQFGFVQVTSIADPEEFRDHFDGKLGLGYSETKDHDFNFIQKLKDANLINKRIFSINEITGDKGLLFIGDVPAKRYPYCNITNHSVFSEDYQESWICNLTHVGSFKESDGTRTKLESYQEISIDKAAFDSAYDFISVPVKERKIIENFLQKAGLQCHTNEQEDTSYKHNHYHYNYETGEKVERPYVKPTDNTSQKPNPNINISYANGTTLTSPTSTTITTTTQNNTTTQTSISNSTTSSINNTGTVVGEMVGSADWVDNSTVAPQETATSTTNQTQIRKLLSGANNQKTRNRKKYRYDEEEISIFCKATPEEMNEKTDILSFVFQGNSFSIPIKHLYKESTDGEVELLIKYMDNPGAIWSLGFPFMNQFLMIFNFEDKHVGFKKLKKTALNIIDLSNQWDIWNADKVEVIQGISLKSAKLIAIVLCAILVLIVGYLIYQALCKIMSSETKDMRALREEVEQPKFNFDGF